MSRVSIEDSKAAALFLLRSIGEDTNREGLVETPRRVAEMYQELVSGYEIDTKLLLKQAIFQEGGDEMVVIANIPFYSLCEHHLIPFFGYATVGYIPLDGRVAGLSKFARIVEAFAKRLQVQERMTTEIADTMFDTDTLNPEGVGVYIRAEHLCLAMRGIQKPSVTTKTQALRGSFLKDSEVRAEWLASRNGDK